MFGIPTKLALALGLAGVLLVAGFLGYRYVKGLEAHAYSLGVANTQKEFLQAIAKGNLQDQQFVDTLNSTLTKGLQQVNKTISNIKVENKTVYNEVTREVQNNPVYTECKSTDDGTRMLNDARGYVSPK